MNKNNISVFKGMQRAAVALLLCLSALSVHAGDVMTKKADGTYVVRTTTICKARGYRKGTPVEVHIKKGNVVKVVALKNEETVPYFSRVKQFLLPLYNNLKLSKAKKLTEQTKVDGCTGATFSTKAVQKNIHAAIEYYEKNK
ncbi:MAG: FMN-binding protein [Prevotella sp.]|nr:FMN-binding protein [Prevotella sp.]MDY5492019.1 FMN-binding protein [Prevotella sp.]